MMRWLACALALAGCATGAPDTVVLAIDNAGAQPLRCLVIHGHWVTGDMPVIAPGATTEVTILRDPAERSLYTLRDDGRRLMIEQIACGLGADWSATLTYAQVDAARTTDATRFVLACDVARPGGCAAFSPAP